MAVSFNNLVDDNGTNTTGTFIDKAEFQLLLMGAVVTSTSTGAQNNWAPGLDGHTLIEWAGASDAAFTGLAAGTAGQIAMIRNTGTKVGTFAHLSGSSSAANQFTNSATSGVTPVAPGGSVIYRHDGTNWKLVGHEQGAWITPTFAAGNFTGNGAMTWTVDAGDVVLCRYRLDGRTLKLAVLLATLTVGGTPNTALQVGNGAYGGFVSTVTSVQLLGMVKDNGAALASAYVSVVASGTNVATTKLAGGNFAAATNATELYFDFAFEVN